MENILVKEREFFNFTFSLVDYTCEDGFENESDFCNFEVNSKVLDAFESYKTNLVKSMIGFNLMARLTLGNFFYLALIHYEKYGGDPMKRTAINQIISLICMTLVINSLVSQPIVTWSFIVGPVSGPLANFALFDAGATNGMMLICFAQIVALQNLQAFKFPTFSSVDEDFLARFLSIWNIGFLYGSFLGLWYLDDFPVGAFEFLTGTLTGKIRHHRGNEFWFVITLINVSLMTSGTLMFHLKKCLDKKKDLNTIPTVGQNQYNNQAKNEQIISRSAIIIVVFSLATILTLLIFYGLDTKLTMVHGTIISDIAIDFSIGVIVPILVLIKNKSFRKHLQYSLF